MANTEVPIITLNISEKLYDIRSKHFDTKTNELFIVGLYDQIAITTFAGKLLSIQDLPERSTIIDAQRTAAGWQFINQTDTGLTNCTAKQDSIDVIELESHNSKPKTAAWSPCGEYVAIGSEGTTLSIWNSQTGKRVMRQSIAWDNPDSEEFINPPKISVVSWSENGKEIITTAEAMVSSSVIVWDFKSQKIVTIIQ